MMQHIKNLLAPKKTVLAVALSYSVLVTIALLCPIDGNSSLSFKHMDKVVHFSIHFLLALIWLLYCFIRNNRKITSRLWVVIMGLIFLYGIIIEILQTYMTAGRTGEALDVAANSLGLVAGLVVFRIFQKKIYNLTGRLF